MTTMTKAIMQEMFVVDKVSGSSDIKMDTIKDIIKKHDPQGFDKFEPDYE